MNRLKQESSPYLRQHAENPVDWFPWGEEALQLARATGKPILLSVGYSACHWCHVMARECFSNPSLARLMNRFFVCIKVDREERPDIDRLYQTAHQLLTRKSGGWPLTMFLTPEGIPFFGGTYFPPEPRHGLPGFGDLMQRVVDYHDGQGPELARQSRALLDAFPDCRPVRPVDAEVMDAAPLRRFMEQATREFDDVHGGFGGTPKFPHPPILQALLREVIRRGNQQAGGMLRKTLHPLLERGLYDQVGGGFFRYAVDRAWRIPHFEKMLYDNAMLLGWMADMVGIADSAWLHRKILETGNWVIRDMQSRQGGYHAALDADSEGGDEGGYYLWSEGEMSEILDAEEWELAALRFGLAEKANRGDRWHLNVVLDIPEIAKRTGLTERRVTVVLSGVVQKLFQQRQRRVPPVRDDKILCAWNALMIRAMARAGRHLDHPPFVESARQALTFLWSRLWKNGRLLAVCRGEHSYQPAFLEDHVYLIDAILEVLQTGWRQEFFVFALALADGLLERFEDTGSGGFFMTAEDQEQLFVRGKSFHDEAVPSANAVAVRVLGRLGYLTGNQAYLDSAQRVLRAAWPLMSGAPLGFAGMVTALDEYLHPPRLVVVRDSEEQRGVWQTATAVLEPDDVCLLIPPDESGLPDSLAHQTAGQAYVCRGFVCSAAVDNPAGLRRILEQAV